MFDLSTNAIIVAFTTYIVSGLPPYKQEETEEIRQVITFWDRIPVFIPVINTFFAIWSISPPFHKTVTIVATKEL